MKHIQISIIASFLVIVLFVSNPAKAGNDDRAGQAAAAHLLINPWAATNGWGSAGISFTKGIQAMYTNVAGMAFTQKTEIAYSNTLYNFGSQTMINGFGLVQNLGRDRGNVGLAVMIMSLGNIPRTTVDNPEGGLGTFPATVMNIGASYALSFSNYVHAGVSFKVINESTANATATGFAIDAGVQYVTGKNDQFRLGVVLKNIGLPMRYSGDGLSLRSYLNKNSFPSTVLIPSESSEMPALLGLGLSYDFLFGNKSGSGSKDIRREDAMHRITLAGSYVANAYSKDQFIIGLEYGLLEYFQVRGGYTIEDFKPATSKTNLSGPSAGMSVLIPLNKKQQNENPSRIALDYSYRFTRSWDGCHAIGLRIIL